MYWPIDEVMGPMGSRDRVEMFDVSNYLSQIMPFYLLTKLLNRVHMGIMKMVI